jgi:hypothetical protein
MAFAKVLYGLVDDFVDPPRVMSTTDINARPWHSCASKTSNNRLQ